ncbi:MAG: type II toxin-antitoxin system VapC family toxin [Defluviicoccus sp.]
MVLDTSAILAILFDEPERAAFVRLIAADPVRLLSAASLVEVSLVIESRKGEGGRADLELFLAEAGIDVHSVTPAQAALACDAYRRFGKGRHPAGLNFGDIFAYALAKAMGEPLLFKGDDFARTDIARVAPAADQPT